VDTSGKTVAKTADTKLAKAVKPKPKTAQSKPSSKGTDDVCIIDSDSESEDFNCKQSKKRLNNSDIGVTKRSQVKCSDAKQSSCVAASVSQQQHDVEADKQRSSESRKKASVNTSKRSKGKQDKDNTSDSISPPAEPLKPGRAHLQVILFLYPFLLNQ